MLNAPGDGAYSLDWVEGLAGLGIGTVVLVFVGRQMARLWAAWGEYGAVAARRSHDDEERADVLQRELTQAQIKLAAAEVRNEYQERELQRLMLIIERHAPPPTDG